MPSVVPVRAPSRYIDCDVAEAASTTWCHLPSLTVLGVTICQAVVYWSQNFPWSLPSVPTYRAGTQLEPRGEPPVSEDPA